MEDDKIVGLSTDVPSPNESVPVEVTHVAPPTPIQPPSGTGLGAPSNDAAMLIQYTTIITQQTTQIAEQTTQISQLHAQIAQLQTYIDQLQAPKQAAPLAAVAPVTQPNPNVMTTSTFLVGVASVLAIGGGVWWVARNAKTKAREAHAAGAFAKKPIANPKQLTTGEAR